MPGYDLSVASYDSNSYDVSAQITVAVDVKMSADGTKMYVLNEGGPLYQYTLSTAFDLSTASYASKSLALTNDNSEEGVFFKPDGAKVYVAGSQHKTVYQYSLATPWDLSTGTYDSVSFSLLTQITSLGLFNGLFFKPDGTAMYSGGSGTVYQYTLGTAWDMSTASYASKSLSTSTQNPDVTDVSLSDDGSKLFVSGANTISGNHHVYQYNLSTAWDVSTGSYSGTSYSVGSQTIVPHGMAWNSDGTKLFVAGSTTKKVFRYSTGTLGTGLRVRGFVVQR